MEVIVYSSPACGYCVQLKDWLKEHNIEFKEIVRGKLGTRGKLGKLGTVTPFS